MDKSVFGLLGGASALALASGAASAAASPMSEASQLRPAQSFAELLDPIPNAVNTLRAQEGNAGNDGGEPLQLAQYYYGYPHHHHHHHYRHHHQYYYNYYPRHHHHHHHHVVIPVPIPQ